MKKTGHAQAVHKKEYKLIPMEKRANSTNKTDYK